VGLERTRQLVLQIFPFLAWLAAITSGVLIVVLWTAGDLGRREGSVLVGWFLAAGFCQFSGASAFPTTAGLVLQTTLAIYLILRWKVSG
jgi:hypothetical protein